jgi:ABC-type transporter Mla subunit MlaD
VTAALALLAFAAGLFTGVLVMCLCAASRDAEQRKRIDDLLDELDVAVANTTDLLAENRALRSQSEQQCRYPHLTLAALDGERTEGHRALLRGGAR